MKYRVGSGTKVNEISKKLESESHFRQRIFGRIDGADVENLNGAEFDLLFGAGGREFEVPVDDDAGSGRNELTQVAERRFNDNLQVTGAASVVDFEKCERVFVSFPSGLHPAADARLPASEGGATIGPGDDESDRDAVREVCLGNVVEGDGGKLVRRRRR